ncbi:MAG: linear amide C-N hydrolase [Cyclobacteriaceae bacterium]|nr:linear amide C-N hydrolase [Cyclobacteriaceae bacterium]
MTQTDEHIVNLDLPANERWEFLNNYKSEINELLQYYLNDFEGAGFLFESIGLYKKEIISSEYLAEIEFISSISNFSSDQVLIANLYYDVLKFYFGCTAFAVETNGSILHSRNLDWWTDNNILSKFSKIFHYQKNGKTIYKTVGWVGFVGALSGTKPGRFSLTLNAVLSKDKPEIAIPISFFLRDILNTANSYDEAKEKLEQTPIASDCLILLSGTRPNEMVVIERTPTRSATRTTDQKYIIVTNDYKKLENNTQGESVLQSTSCGRFDRTQELLENQTPTDFVKCFDILQDKNVMMGITVQQMVFINETGEIKLLKTGVNNTYPQAGL